MKIEYKKGQDNWPSETILEVDGFKKKIINSPKAVYDLFTRKIVELKIYHYWSEVDDFLKNIPGTGIYSDNNYFQKKEAIAKCLSEICPVIIKAVKDDTGEIKRFLVTGEYRLIDENHYDEECDRFTRRHFYDFETVNLDDNESIFKHLKLTPSQKPYIEGEDFDCTAEIKDGKVIFFDDCGMEMEKMTRKATEEEIRKWNEYQKNITENRRKIKEFKRRWGKC